MWPAEAESRVPRRRRYRYTSGMSHSRLSAIAVLAAAFALAACGNKADLFMPPPPVDEGVIEDDWGEPVEEEAIEDEAASQEATGLPLPVPTGDGLDQATPPVDDDDSDPPPPDPTGDG